MNKYQLPEVASLKKIGFEFEFSTLDEVPKYIKKLSKKNKKELTKLFLGIHNKTQFNHYQKLKDFSNDIYIVNILKTKLRIASGNIQKDDYMWFVPPCCKNDKSALMKAHQKRLEKYMIGTKYAFYDQSYLGINEKKAQQLVLQNEILKLIILNLPKNPLGAVKKNKKLKKINRINTQIATLKFKRMNYTGSPLLVRSCNSDIAKLEWEKYVLLFSLNSNVRQQAERTLKKINKKDGFMEYTSIAEKENVIRQYLKMQTPAIRKSRNTRGSGINAGKKQKVFAYKKQNPLASISEIARNCNVDPKTVRKYLNH